MRPINRYLAAIGARGGRKSRRTLSPEAAAAMVRVREAGRAYRRFHDQCFAAWPSDRRITAADIEWVAERLLAFGDDAARTKAVKLMPLALVAEPRSGRRPVRYDITARILPRRSAEAASTYVVATRERRIAMVEELSAELWALAKLPLPSYSRAEMPVHIMPRARRSPSP
jgi:hypothetical protein